MLKKGNNKPVKTLHQSTIDNMINCDICLIYHKTSWKIKPIKQATRWSKLKQILIEYVYEKYVWLTENSKVQILETWTYINQQ